MDLLHCIMLWLIIYSLFLKSNESIPYFVMKEMSSSKKSFDMLKCSTHIECVCVCVRSPDIEHLSIWPEGGIMLRMDERFDWKIEF